MRKDNEGKTKRWIIIRRIFDFHNFSLRKKFSVTLCFFVILPLIVVTAVITDSMYVNDYHKTCETQQSLLLQGEISIKSFTNDLQQVSINILGNTDVQTFIKKYVDPSTTSSEKELLTLGFSLLPFIESRSYISSISIFNEKEILYQYGERVKNEEMEFYSNVINLKGKPYWSDAYIQTDDYNKSGLKGKNISLYRVINDLYSFERGIAIERISVKEDYVCSLYSAINSDTSTMYIVNDRGVIISSTKKELIGTTISNDYKRTLFSKKSGIIKEKENTIFFESQSSPSWCLVMEEENNVLYGSANLILLLMVGIIVLIIIFGMIFLALQNHSMIKPLSILSKETLHFREGNFTISEISSSRDEIGELNKSLMKMSEYIKNLIEQDYKSRLSQREMELEYLQSQMNPHFLYNTLDSIRWLAVMHSEDDIANQIIALSELFRHTLNSGDKYTTIKNEITHLKAYILIQGNRFAERINFIFDVKEELKSCKVIKLLIQPLIENAIKYGFKNEDREGTIKVSIYEKCSKLYCCVSDNGSGTNEAEIRKYISGEIQKASFALKNINERIKLEYGDEYGLEFYSTFGIGTSVEIRLPIVRDKEHMQ